MSRYIAILLFFVSAHGWAECPSTDPEETLECYFNAVDAQDEQGIAEVFLDFPGYHFNVSEKPEREIHKKMTLAKNLVGPMSNGEVPIWAHKGNREIWIIETYSNWSHIVSFYLKEKQGKWYVAGYSSHNQPE
ncbi:hypothetical protein [Microbulbifer sp. JMSA003]|uniref:hypothetical protein n=1 Tax=Microbulbifer sp. JMSA003 TaxID=3243369 RepID=UPI0040390F28